MPLDQSGSKESIGKNISELMSTGKYPQKQAVAIAESVARRARGKVGVKKGGKVGMRSRR